MDGVLAILIIPLLLAALILVILNMLDYKISIIHDSNSKCNNSETIVTEGTEGTEGTEVTDDEETGMNIYNSALLDEHKASVAHTQMLNVDHNSSVGAHLNFDDKYMSSSAVKALIDETNTSSSHKELIGSLVSSSMNSTLTAHNTSSTAHNLNKYKDLGNKLKTLEDTFNSHTHVVRHPDGTKPSIVTDSTANSRSYTFTNTSDLNWTPV